MKKGKMIALILGAILLIGIGGWFMIGGREGARREVQSTDDLFLEKDPFQSTETDGKENGEEISNPYGGNEIHAEIRTPVSNQTLLYDGPPISLEYEFSCKYPCVLGLMIYVDGFLQPYTVSGQETIMHTVNMGAKDTQRFTLSFTPVSGRKGEELTVVFANINNAVVLELSGDLNTFGNNQKISQSMPWKLQLQEDSPGNAFQVTDAFEIKAFSDKDREQYIRVDRDGNRRNRLDDCCKVEIRRGETVLDGKAAFPAGKEEELAVYVYGNLTGRYRVSLYGDFEQIPINGCDYVDIEVQRDAYSVIPFRADFGKLGIKNLYAVAAPVEADDFLEKSPSVCIVEE